jgi:hypothetical protein
MGQRMCLDWSAVAAIARTAEAAFGPARGAQRRQSHAYLDDSLAHDGSAKRAIFGKDSYLQKRGHWICFCWADVFCRDFWRRACFRGDS